MDEVLTTQEAAAAVGVSDSRVRQLVSAGHMTPARKAGRTYLFRRCEVERYVNLPRRGPGRPRKLPERSGDA